MDHAKSRRGDVVRILFELCFDAHDLGSDPVQQNELVNVAARYAWALYYELDRAGIQVVPSAGVLNRRAPLGPDDPRFFHCLETLEEFTALAAEAVSPPPAT